MIGILFVFLLSSGLVFVENTTSQNNQESREIPFPSYEQVSDFVFDQKISCLMRIAGYPSVSASIIKDDQIIWSKSYGYYDLLEQKQATCDTIYLLASITKPVVGTALMTLYEQELFDLDDDVNQLLPFDLRNPHFPDDPITFRMLLSHTSSLNTNTQQEYYWFNFSGDPPFDFFPDPYLKEFLLPNGRYYDESVWSDTYRPGEHAMYANVGFDLIAYLVEIISGDCFLDYCDSTIFIPLGMRNTSFNLSRLPIDQVAIPYQRIRGTYYHINELDYNNTGTYWRKRPYPAGGLYSTISDFSRFLIAHMNDGVYQDVRILEKETIRLMHEVQPGNNIGYGLAWMHYTLLGYDHMVSGHRGSYPGVNTWMSYDAIENIGVIYLANGNSIYSSLPFQGFFIDQWILRSLFTRYVERNILDLSI